MVGRIPGDDGTGPEAVRHDRRVLLVERAGAGDLDAVERPTAVEAARSGEVLGVDAPRARARAPVLPAHVYAKVVIEQQRGLGLVSAHWADVDPARAAPRRREAARIRDSRDEHVVGAVVIVRPGDVGTARTVTDDRDG